MQNIKTLVWIHIFIIYTRYLLGGTFVFASVIKIKGKRFTGESGALHPIDTAWHFFETMYESGLYWKFIGVSQLLAGFLLMTQKYSKLGALVNFPLILNIFVITLSYYFAFTYVITGMILFANLILLAWDWDHLKILFNLKPTYDYTPRLEDDIIWQIIGLILFLFTFIYRVMLDRYDMIFWTVICLIIGILGFIVGIKRHRIRKKCFTIPKA